MSAEHVHPSSAEGENRPPQVPESYTWPLVAIVIVMLPQVLVPVQNRIGPPLIVPIIEAAAFLVMLAIAAKPGPVPRRARPVVLGQHAADRPCQGTQGGAVD
jgi:hypothetical protein